MKRSSILMATLAIVAVTFPIMAQSESPIVANINDETLTVEQFDALWNDIPTDIQKRYESVGGRIRFLDNYIRRRLMVQQAERIGLGEDPSVPKASGSERDSRLFDLYLRDVVSQQVLSEDTVREYYEARKAQLNRPERVHARHIIITPVAGQVENTTGSDATSEQEALAIASELRRELVDRPELFESLARQFSEDPSASSGGDLGWFARGTMVAEFEEVAFAAAPGEISPIVETRFGYHLILVEGRQEAAALSFEEVRKDLRRLLTEDRLQEVMAAAQRVSDQLWLEGKVEVFKENIGK